MLKQGGTHYFPEQMTKIWRFQLLPCLLLSAICQGVFSNQGNQSLQSITDTVVLAGKRRAQALGYDNVKVQVRPLDERLRLPGCEQPLDTFMPPGAPSLGAVNVGVRCASSQPWTIYVRAHISAQRAVPVLARPLARNTIISEADLTVIDQPIDMAISGVVYEVEQIIGMELTRSLDAGSTIGVNQLRPPKVIKRGQQVTLVAGAGNLQVRMQGKALGDATAGERVRVTNLSSNQQVEGIANSDGTVSVP